MHSIHTHVNLKIKLSTHSRARPPNATAPAGPRARSHLFAAAEVLSFCASAAPAASLLAAAAAAQRSGNSIAALALRADVCLLAQLLAATAASRSCCNAMTAVFGASSHMASSARPSSTAAGQVQHTLASSIVRPDCCAMGSSAASGMPAATSESSVQ